MDTKNKIGIVEILCRDQNKIMLISKHIGNCRFLICGKAYVSLRGAI